MAVASVCDSRPLITHCGKDDGTGTDDNEGGKMNIGKVHSGCNRKV